MTFARFSDLTQRTRHPSYKFHLGNQHGRWSVWVSPRDGTDNVTGAPLTWKSRKWPLSEHMTDSEVVQTLLLATLTAVEHETRELFTFDSQTVYDGHLDVHSLVALRQGAGGGLDVRDEPIHQVTDGPLT